MTSAPPKSDDNLNDSFKKSSHHNISSNKRLSFNDLDSTLRQPYLSGNDDDDNDLESDDDYDNNSQQISHQTTSNNVNLEDENILRNGYLDKKGGGRRKNWKKRWFVLRPTKLAIYKSDKEYRLLRLIDITSIHTCAQVDVGKKHQNVFGLVTPDRTFYLKSNTPLDMESWVEAINLARKKVKDINNLSITTNFNNNYNESQQISPINIPLSPYHQPHSNSNRRSSLTSTNASRSPNRLENFSLPNTFISDGGESPNDRQSSSDDDDDEPQQSSTLDPNKVILTGYLMKLSKRKSWRKRYFTLTSEILSYSRSHLDKGQRRIPLSKILDSLECDNTLQSPTYHVIEKTSHQHTFKVITPKRTFVLSAQSEEEEIRWLSALQTLLAHKRGQPVVEINASPLSLNNKSTPQYLGPPPPITTQPPTPQPHKLVDVPEEESTTEVLSNNVVNNDSSSINPISNSNTKHKRTRSGTIEARAAVDAVTKKFHPPATTSNEIIQH